MEEKKSVLPKILLLLVGILIGMGGVYLFLSNNPDFINGKNKDDKDTENTNKKEPTEETKKTISLDVNSNEVLNFDIKLNAVDGCSTYYNYYTDKKVSSTDISNDTALALAFNEINTNDKYSSYRGKDVDGTVIEGIVKTILGKNYQYKHNSSLMIEYDANANIYKAWTGFGGTCVGHNYSKIVKALKTDNTIEIYKRILFLDSNFNGNIGNYYSDYNKTKFIATKDFSDMSSPDNMDNYINNGGLYKTVFKLEDGNYVYDYTEPTVE